MTDDLLVTLTNQHRVKTVRKDEIEIVRKDKPTETGEHEDRSGSSFFSRNVSFELLSTETSSSSPELSKEINSIESERPASGIEEMRKSNEIEGSTELVKAEQKKVDQREELVKELVRTEKKYCRDLDIIVEVPM